MFGKPQTTTLLILIFVIVGGFLRFYNLNWGAPYYFHPDERNIASSVSQLRFPDQMNPGFFAYGSLPIYTIYFLGLIKNIVTYCSLAAKSCLPTDMTAFAFMHNPVWQQINRLSFEDAIITGRIVSALFSTLLIALVFKLGQELHSDKAGILTAFLTAMSVGFIQFAHFGTFEIWLTFFSVLLFLVCIRIIKQYRPREVLLTGIVLGILAATKISHIVLLPLPLISIILALYATSVTYKRFSEKLKIYLECIAQITAVIVISAAVFFLTNPYILLDFAAFKNSLDYESGVALGTTNVFYTHEFINTAPVTFQFLHVYPFLINPLLTLLFIPAFAYVVWITIKNKNKFYLLLATCYLLLFLSQAFLFVKWTRYMIPTLSFIYLMISISFIELIKYNKAKLLNYLYYRYIHILIVILIIGTSVLFAFSYYKIVLSRPDTRIEAAGWAKKHLDHGEIVMSESYDIGIIAFNSALPKIALCDLYNLEQNPLPCNGFPLQEVLDQSRYIILPSERILKMSLLQKEKFPDRYKFYHSLLTDTQNYSLVYKTPCDLFCRVLYLDDPLYTYEQTANVFDRPTVYIFEKR